MKSLLRGKRLLHRPAAYVSNNYKYLIRIGYVEFTENYKNSKYYTVSQKTTVTLHTITSMHINRF